MSKRYASMLLGILLPITVFSAGHSSAATHSCELQSVQSTVISRPALDLQIQLEADNAVRLTWNADPLAAGYYLYRADQPSVPGSSNWGIPDFVTVHSTWFNVTDTARFYYVSSVFPPPPAFIEVPGGTFNPAPNYAVTLSTFHLDRYEVTLGSFESIMGWLPSGVPAGLAPNHPVYYCTWFNAIEYCNRRSLQEGLAPCYSYSSYGTDPDTWPAGWNTAWANHALVACNFSVSGYRLPTEMEWMYAACGGSLSQGFLYSGGDILGLVGWYRDIAASPQMIGLKRINELGFCDMSGNIFEWCWDKFNFANQDYPTGSETDPTGPVSGNGRRLRGGAWGSYDYQCTVSYRSSAYAWPAGQLNGFRLARSSID